MASRSIPKLVSAEAQINNRIVGTLSDERLILVTLFVCMIVFYGAIGRDVFYNRLYMSKDAVDDPIGAVLPHLRLLTCLMTIGLISYKVGINWVVSKIPYVFAPVAVLALLSYFWADDSKAALRNAIVMTSLWIAMPILMFRMGVHLVVQTSLYIIAWIMILSVFVAIMFPHIGIHDGHELIQSGHVGRWRGIFSHKNALGPWAAYGSVFLFTHSWLCNGNKLFFWVARACALLCLAMAGSATGIVTAFSLAGLHMMFLSLRRLGLATTAVIMVILLLGAITFWYSGNTELVFNALGRDSTLTGRAGIWQICWGFIWEHPWFGNGYQMNGGSAILDRTRVLYGQQLSAESGYLSMLLDMGFVGTFFFIFPNVISLRNGFEWIPLTTPRDRACIEYLLAVMLVAFVQSIDESNIMICTGFDGILSFTAFFGLMALPKSPVSLFRGEFRLAKHSLQRRKSRRDATDGHQLGSVAGLS